MPERVDTKSLIRRGRQQKQNRGDWDHHYEDLARVLATRHEGFTVQTVEGSRRGDDIYDGSPMQAARGLANAIGSLMRPVGGEPWVKIKAADDDVDNTDEATDWLQHASKVLFNKMTSPKSRSIQALGETDFQLVVFGEAPLFVGQHMRHLMFQSAPLREAFVYFNDDGTPGGMFYFKKFTIREMVNKFGPDRLSEKTAEKYKQNKFDDKIECMRAIVPRAEGRTGAMLARNMPYADYWIEVTAEHLLREGGFHEFPYVVPRWDTTSGEDHARSPGMIALPDAETLQAMGETLLVAGERAADPPLFAPDDGSFDPLNTFPGGVSYYDVATAERMRGNPFFTLDNGTNVPITLELMQDRREIIFNAFFRHVLNLPVFDHQMTATEIIERKEEFIREIGPVFGRLETDYTAPTVERCFNILLRAGSFRPIPDILLGKGIRFEYASPIKAARDRVEAMAAREWVLEQIEFSEADPTALDLVNFEEYGRISARARGVPTAIINDRETVKARAEARNKAAKEEAAIAGAQDIAETAGMAGQAMQQIPAPAANAA